jgi:hypothetical protein
MHPPPPKDVRTRSRSDPVYGATARYAASETGPFENRPALPLSDKLSPKTTRWSNTGAATAAVLKSSALPTSSSG